MIHKINYLLEEINTFGSVYDEFIGESVLTANQLNKLTDYFEDADRLRTTKLHGVGIVCGFQYTVYQNNNGRLNDITVTPGVAITTDGDLLHTIEKTLSRYIPFKNKADYDLLEKGGDIFELREKEAADTLQGELPLSSLINFKDYKLVVYLEHYKVDPGLCSATSCDDTGNHVHMDQKFLLVHKKNWATLMEGDTIFHEHNVWNFYNQLPNLSVNRAVVKPNVANAATQVYALFNNEIKKIRDTKQLEKVYLALVDRFDPRIDFKRHGINVVDVKNKFASLFDNTNNTLDIQYRYDALKDLLETYTEIKNLVLHLNVECNPNLNAFPKHISLGGLNTPNNAPERHRFYYSPLHKDKKNNLEHFKSIMIRFWQQLSSYSFKANQTIKITSSRDFESSIGQRAIPYYYNYSKTSAHWDQQLVDNRLPNLAHSYHRGGGNSSVFYPNQVSHLDKEFYRIEGHLGQSHVQALSQINALKRDLGLAFDVKAVAVNFSGQDINWADFKCHFTDLAATLEVWQVDFICITKGFKQFFGDMPTDGSYFKRGNLAANRYGQSLHPEAAVDLAAATTDSAAKKATTATGGMEEVVVTAGVYKKISEVVSEQIKTDAVDCNLSDKVIANYNTQEASYLQYRLAIQLPTKMYIYALMFANKERSWSEFLNDVAYLNDTLNTISNFCNDTKALYAALQILGQQLSLSGNPLAFLEFMNIYNRMKEACCYITKLQWVKKEIDKRKKKILMDLTLSEFVKKHSGAEHMAGVGKGQTFIMLYDGQSKQKNPFNVTSAKIMADFTLPYLCATECAPSQIMVLPPMEDPEEPTIEYRITNKETDFCENQEFRLDVNPNPGKDVSIQFQFDGDSSRHDIQANRPALLGEKIVWKKDQNEMTVLFFIDEKVQEYKAKIHRRAKVEYSLDRVENSNNFALTNKSKESCNGKLFAYITQKGEEEKQTEIDEKWRLTIKEEVIVRIVCETERCRSEYKTTLTPIPQGKERITLDISSGILDGTELHFIEAGSGRPLSDPGYKLFVNNIESPLKLNANNMHLMQITQKTDVKITFENAREIGEWTGTLNPRVTNNPTVVDVFADVKSEISKIDKSLRANKPSDRTLVNALSAELNFIAQVDKALVSIKNAPQVLATIASAKQFNILDGIKSTDTAFVTLLNEHHLGIYFSVLRLVSDADFKKAMSPVESSHLAYFKKYKQYVSKSFVSKMSKWKYDAPAVNNYIKGVIGALK